MGNHNCHESPDGFHEVCKRFVATASPEVWENLAPHMLVCLAAAGVLVSGICAWRLHTRRDRNGREQPDCEWQPGKNVLVVPAIQPFVVGDHAGDGGLGNFLHLNHSKDAPYKDDKVDSVKAGEYMQNNTNEILELITKGC
ncbi:hypothetical protein GRF29_8g2756837 [Pseudopithomyces chartarum]|uniref:Uncharacterized protein n=1 Tax=Pseudopithomyces chartarum TaxID=1892770 RepID=A0AAN6RK77_9PLEO|nr:hypothetical protein GRF29_8g2756837 [Pseudopithomyces chartarum]